MKSRRGFTLVEVMVVVTVTALLAGVILVYNSSSRAQIELFTEKAKVAQVVLRARSLAISTYTNDTVPCGYGVAIDPVARTYGIVTYVLPDCHNITSIDTDPSTHPPLTNEQYTLPPSLTFDTTNQDLRYIIFIPPDPRVILADADGQPLSSGSGAIALKSVSGSFTATIGVNSNGEVAF